MGSDLYMSPPSPGVKAIFRNKKGTKAAIYYRETDGIYGEDAVNTWTRTTSLHPFDLVDDLYPNLQSFTFPKSFDFPEQVDKFYVDGLEPDRDFDQELLVIDNKIQRNAEQAQYLADERETLELQKAQVIRDRRAAV